MNLTLLGAFLGGILTLLSPCSVMLLPAFFAYAFSSPGALLARRYTRYCVRGVSMEPAFHDGDFLVVDREGPGDNLDEVELAEADWIAVAP